MINRFLAANGGPVTDGPPGPADGRRESLAGGNVCPQRAHFTKRRAPPDDPDMWPAKLEALVPTWPEENRDRERERERERERDEDVCRHALPDFAPALRDALLAADAACGAVGRGVTPPVRRNPPRTASATAARPRPGVAELEHLIYREETAASISTRHTPADGIPTTPTARLGCVPRIQAGVCVPPDSTI